MQRLTIMIYLTSLLSGCSANEANYTDRDFALAQYAMEKQIITPAPRDQSFPEGMQAMDAERMMQTWSKTFDPPKRNDAKRYFISTDSE